MKNLVLERVEVKKLFNRFDYNLDFRNGMNISILHAPNGCGKTTLFRMITFLLAPTKELLESIEKIPFVKCTVYLTDGLKIEMEPKSLSQEYLDFYKEMVKSMLEDDYEEEDDSFDVSRKPKTFQIIVYDKSGSSEKTIDDSKKMISEISRGHLSTYEYSENLSLMETRRKSKFVSDYKSILDKMHCSTKINFITADRLHSSSDNKSRGVYHFRSRREYEKYRETFREDPLKQAKKFATEMYNSSKEEYNRLQSEAKAQLPQSYLNSSLQENNYSEFETQWTTYVNDIEKYCKIGLLDSAETIIDKKELEKYFNKNSSFLSIYLKLFSNTLKPLADVYDKMKLFVDILNGRNKVTHKTFKFGKEGIEVLVDDQPLPLNCLSSGEKNDFVMFFNLIFKSEPESLVLIDEPEISLHIEWQETYLDFLLKICEMNNLQTIVATHSPNIINGHIELYAAKGLADGC